MKVLAFDLDWTGETGWCLYDDDLNDPVVEYGEFKPVLGNDLDEASRTITVARQIVRCVRKVYDTHLEKHIDAVTCEVTDWHQNLMSKGRMRHDWQVRYAIERQAQRTLGRAETAFLIAVDIFTAKTITIGAAEAKREFTSGLITKQAIAEIISLEYERFELIEKAKPNSKFLLYDTKLDQKVAHHVSDAIVVGAVVARRLRQASLVDY